MPAFGPTSRKDLVRCLLKMGFEGPYSGGKHQFKTKIELFYSTSLMDCCKIYPV